MAREPGSKEASAASRSDPREVERLKNEITTLKSQLRQTAPPKPAVVVKYETVDAEEAARYGRAGGRVVTVVKRYPNRPYTPGKVYGFAETKEELEALVKSAKEAGIL